MVARQSKIFAGFRDWLKAGGYSNSTLSQYNVAVRLALGLLDKPHSEIDPAADFDRVQDYLAAASTKPQHWRPITKA